MSELGNSEEEGKSLVDPLFACTLCGACDVRCSGLTGKKLFESFREARNDIVSCGFAPLEAHKVLLDNITKYGNPQGISNTAKLERLTNSFVEAAKASLPASTKSAAKENLRKYLQIGKDLLYFVGCTPALSINVPSQVRSMLSILIRSGSEFSLVGGKEGELCCGHVLFNTGQQKLAFDYMRRAYNAVASTGAKRLLFTCPACYRSFKHEIPNLLGVKPTFSCVTASEFIVELIKEKKLKIMKSGSDERVTYHDPCHLGRLSGIYDSPRELIRATGAMLVEMPRNRERAWCCGTGGGVKTAFPDMARTTALSLVEEALSTGAKTILTACPACESGITDALKGAAKTEGVEVKDVVDLVATCLAP